MGSFKKFSGIVIMITVFTFGLTGLSRAATTVNLNTADDFAILAGSTITNTGSSVVTGNLGISPGASVTGFPPGTVSGTQHIADATAIQAKVDLVTAYDNAAGQSCDDNLTGQNLGGLTLTPGTYCFDTSAQLTGVLTLDAGGNPDAVFIFQIGSTLTTASDSDVVMINSGQSCHVFWQVGTSATLGTGTDFMGSILALTSATLNTGADVDGRVLARNGAVTLDTNDVSVSVCTASSGSGGSNLYSGTINVVKTVINDNEGTKTVSDFPLFINGTSVVSGTTNDFSFFTTTQYTVTETSDPGYTQTFSGDCESDGTLYLHPAENKICVITNDDIATPVVIPPVPPLIDVVKVPSPLILPDGPDMVDYTYTLRNIGTVPVTDITMVGDTCYPIVLASGDTNADAKLDVTETWVYTCSKIISETHTNTVVATGWANGLSATDIASATVIVNDSIVPPLIHITKIPDPLTLLAGGGTVTYTETITNPGTEALNNVILTDDKCSPVTYVSGDANGDLKLDPTESWAYTCQTNLTKTTSNIATASGEANGLTVRDFAIAIVTVATAVPDLPQTGFVSDENSTSRNIVIVVGLLTLVSALFVALKKHRT